MNKWDNWKGIDKILKDKRYFSFLFELKNNYFGDSGGLKLILLIGVDDLDESVVVAVVVVVVIFDRSTDIVGIVKFWTKFNLKFDVGAWNGNIANGSDWPVITVLVATVLDVVVVGIIDGMNDVDDCKLFVKLNVKGVGWSGKNRGWFKALTAI